MGSEHHQAEAAMHAGKSATTTWALPVGHHSLVSPQQLRGSFDKLGNRFQTPASYSPPTTVRPHGRRICCGGKAETSENCLNEDHRG